MYATLVEMPHGERFRSSFFQTKEDALDYAQRMPGIVAVEKIGGALVWERKHTHKEVNPFA